MTPRRLPPLVVRRGYDGGEQHRRMPVKHIFHFEAGDVLTAGNYDVFGTVANFDIAVRMVHGEIAGMERAATKGVSRSFRRPGSSPP